MPVLSLPIMFDTHSSAALQPARASTWNCRLPMEIIAQVLEILVEKGHLATIGAIQQTSSPLHAAATPFLYRHIQLDLPCAVRLFGLFNRFPLCDNLRFLHPVPDTHLMDMHFADRLRMSLSYTRALTLIIRAQPFVPSPDWREGPKRCHDLVVGSSAFGAHPLWPILESCDVKCLESDLGGPEPWNPLLIQPENYEPFFDAIFAKLHPKHMSLRLPSLDDFNGAEHRGSWLTCLKTLSADQITCIDYDPSVLGLPHATSTLTLCLWTGDPLPLRFVDSHLELILCHRYALRDIQQLKIVGLLNTHNRPSSDVNDFNTANVLHAFDRITHHITDLMSWRLQEGNLGNLDIAIVPEGSPEGEVAAHCCTYKQPEAVIH